MQHHIGDEWKWNWCTVTERLQLVKQIDGFGDVEDEIGRFAALRMSSVFAWCGSLDNKLFHFGKEWTWISLSTQVVANDFAFTLLWTNEPRMQIDHWFGILHGRVSQWSRVIKETLSPATNKSLMIYRTKKRPTVWRSKLWRYRESEH